MKIFNKTILGKELTFSIEPFTEDGEKLFRLTCEAINMNDVFDAEDLTDYITSTDFEYFITDELRRQTKPTNRRIQLRITEAEQQILEKQALSHKAKDVPTYIRNILFTTG